MRNGQFLIHIRRSTIFRQFQFPKFKTPIIKQIANRQLQLLIWKQTQTLTSTIREYVEFVIQDYNKPMGVVTYKTSSEMPEKLRKAMPDIEELKKLL